MQTTSRTPRTSQASQAARSARTARAAQAPRVTTSRFGYFAPVAPPAAPTREAAGPGQVEIEDAQQLLSLFDPRAEPDRSPKSVDAGEYLAPLVPPVISATTREPVSAAPARLASPRRLPTVHLDRRPSAVSRAGEQEPASRQTRRRRLRMTFRGRILVVLFIAAAVSGISVLSGPDAPAAEVAVAGAELVEVEVHEGDTVSSIAKQVGDGQDTATVVSAIQSANDLDASPDVALEPGSIVLVPAG